jgi:YVTN family beta-propeller protein
MRFLPLIGLLTVLTAGTAIGQALLYVADSAASAVIAIDPQGNKVAGAIPVSAGSRAIGISTAVHSTDVRRLYVSSAGKNLLDVVDLRTRKVVGSVAVGPKPGCLALSPDGRRVFVCLAGQPGIDVVDTATMQRIRTIDLAGDLGGSPNNLYVTPDSTRMIAAGDRKLAVINIRSEKVEFAISVDGVAGALAIESDKNLVIQRLFVQIAGSKGCVVVDYASRKVTGRVVTTAVTSALTVSPDQKTLWVAGADDSVSAFSLPDLKKTGTVPVDRGPAWIVCRAGSNRCFVSNSGAGTVSVIDTVAFKEVQRIPAGKIPGRMVLSE